MTFVQNVKRAKWQKLSDEPLETVPQSTYQEQSKLSNQQKAAVPEASNVKMPSLNAEETKTLTSYQSRDKILPDNKLNFEPTSIEIRSTSSLAPEVNFHAHTIIEPAIGKNKVGMSDENSPAGETSTEDTLKRLKKPKEPKTNEAELPAIEEESEPLGSSENSKETFSAETQDVSENEKKKRKKKRSPEKSTADLISDNQQTIEQPQIKQESFQLEESLSDVLKTDLPVKKSVSEPKIEVLKPDEKKALAKEETSTQAHTVSDKLDMSAALLYMFQFLLLRLKNEVVKALRISLHFKIIPAKNMLF